MTELTDIKVGYKIGDKYYNGKGEGLSNVIYSSFTVKTTEGGTETVTAAELEKDYTDITSPKISLPCSSGKVRN